MSLFQHSGTKIQARKKSKEFVTSVTKTTTRSEETGYTLKELTNYRGILYAATCKKLR
jgi:hypothetical protein